MENVFEIRKVSQSDIIELAALYEQVWPNVSFDKLEKVNFVLKESTGVSYCAIKEGEIVGSRTSFFMPAYYGERKLNCVQFADSCIRKDCRRQGLFLKMNQAFLDGFYKIQNFFSANFGHSHLKRRDSAGYIIYFEIAIMQSYHKRKGFLKWLKRKKYL